MTACHLHIVHFAAQQMLLKTGRTQSKVNMYEKGKIQRWARSEGKGKGKQGADQSRQRYVVDVGRRVRGDLSLVHLLCGLGNSFS